VPFLIYKYYHFSLCQISVISITKRSQLPRHSIFHAISSNLFSRTINMAQNATMVWNSNGLAPNITNLDQCTLALCDIKQWGSVNYLPSLTANAIYGGLFAIFFCIHLIFVCIYRTWSYSAPMCLGLTLEVLGYFGRLAMHYNIFNTNLFLV
jgi:hypothetical protein